MIVERKIDSFNKEYLEFNGCSHLYFINGYANNNTMDLYVGSKVFNEQGAYLYEVIVFCLRSFKLVKVHTKNNIFKFVYDKLWQEAKLIG